MKRVWPAVVSAAIVIGIAVTFGNSLLRERDYQAYMTRGDAALASGQTFQAIEAFSGAIALHGDSMIAYLKRGEAYRQRGESGAALRDLRAAERLDPAAARPAELLGDVNYELGRFARAVESYRAFVERDDRSPRVLYNFGLSLYRTGDPSEALPPLRQALALDDKLPEAFYVLGLCLKDLGQPGEMTAAFEQAARLAPAMVAVREELAAAYAAAGRTRAAIEQLEALAALEPGRPERQTVVGVAYTRTGQTDSAVNLLGRAAERYPDNTSVFLAIGRIWLEAAEPRRDRLSLGKAIAALQPLARRPAASSEALALYGRAVMLSGDVVQAEALLARASDTFPVRLEAFIWHAEAAERLGRLAVARRSLDRWVALAPESAAGRGDVLERLGTLASRLGDTPGATAAFRLATEVTSPKASAFTALARLQLSTGQADAARDTANRGLAVFPQDSALRALTRWPR